MWAPKMSTKGRTGDQRTKDKDGQISNLSSLSLSLLCRVCIYSQFFFQEEEKLQNHPSEEGAENPPSFAFLSVFALSRWCCCFIRAREHEESKRASAQGRKTNKQTNKKSQKVPTWHFSASKERQILGDFWRRLFTKK